MKNLETISRLPAPDFKLPDQNGKLHTLQAYLERWLVLYFYPGNESPDCTAQACAFRDEHAIIAQFGNAEIIGVNQDPVDYLHDFSNKFHLNFPLLCDETGDTIRAYDAWEDQSYQGNIFSHVARKTFLIDPEGRIAERIDEVNPHGHAEHIIERLQSLQASA